MPGAQRSLWALPLPPCKVMGEGENSSSNPAGRYPDVAWKRTDLGIGNCRPIILDPADPTGNLGPNARWDLLAKEAAACMSSLCCIGKDGTPIQPWPVKVRDLGYSREHLCWGAVWLGEGHDSPQRGRAQSWPRRAPAPPCPVCSHCHILSFSRKVRGNHIFCHLSQAAV